MIGFENSQKLIGFNELLQTIEQTVLTFSSSYSGYLGLAPGLDSVYSKYPSSLDYAKEEGAIDHKVFAIYANQDSSIKSSVKLGSYDPSGIAPGSQLTYMKTQSPSTWAIEAEGLNLAGSKVKLSSSFKQALVQPLLPFMYIP